jgi:hypothetical protein
VENFRLVSTIGRSWMICRFDDRSIPFLMGKRT